MEKLRDLYRVAEGDRGQRKVASLMKMRMWRSLERKEGEGWRCLEDLAARLVI